MPNTLAVIVNYNQCAETHECLENLRAATKDKGVMVCLVDNSSVGTDQEIGLELKQQADYFLRTKNRGFAAACNLAIHVALHEAYDYVWLVNNDLRIKENTYLGLLNVLETQETAACCSPKIVSYENNALIQFAGGFVQNDGRAWHPRGDWQQDTGQFDKIEPVDWLSGACLLIRTKAFSNTGLFDERFFLYYEDVDWCLRAKANGWTCYYVGTATALHKRSKSTSDVRSYYAPRAHFLFLAKHYPHLVIHALRTYWHHNLRPHLKQHAWLLCWNDLKVYTVFFAKWAVIKISK